MRAHDSARRMQTSPSRASAPEARFGRRFQTRRVSWRPGESQMGRIITNPSLKELPMRGTRLGESCHYGAASHDTKTLDRICSPYSLACTRSR